MKGKTHRIFSLLLTLALLGGMFPAARAANANLQLTYRQENSSSVQLTLHGLGEESIYGVQLDLTLPGQSAGVTFTPADESAYSPECNVRTQGKDTEVTVYITAQKPLNSSGTLTLGTLKQNGSITMPTTVHVKRLGHELKPLAEGGEGVDIPVAEETQSSSSSGSTSKNYRIQVSTARHGEVTANLSTAKSRTEVILTVTPEGGYGLDKLRVQTLAGREMALTHLGGNRYAFSMPGADVEVTASFVWTGEFHVPMSFSDVGESDWFHDEVHFVFDHSMMTGTSEGTFSPNMNVDRGMMVTILHRMSGTPAAELSEFSDVPAGEYYAQAVGWAHANGVVSGYGGNESGTFGPKNPITREQLATILYRYAGKMGYDVTVRGDLSAFTDQGDIAAYARDAMSWAVGTGLIAGMQNNQIAPGGTASRAQAAVILTRFCRQVVI